MDAGDRTKQASKTAIPVFTVNSVDEARFLQITLCVHRWDGSYALTQGLVTDKKVLDYEDLDAVTAVLREVYARHQALKAERLALGR